jgi:5-oxoprolinase (ATP-hydrolysing)
MRGWQFWIDRGGTFTDVIAVAPDGRLYVRKALSQAAETASGDPGLRVIQSILDAAAKDVPAEDAGPPAVAALKVGTTVATNALLERTGEPVLLVTTAGFADALRIGDQSRPDIFALRIEQPEALHADVVEVSERLSAGGEVLIPLDRAALRRDLVAARNRGYRALAIVFLNAWRHPQHECEAAAIARESGFEEVSVSHQVSPLIRYVPRAATTVLNAYLAPVLKRYVSGLKRELAVRNPRIPIELMQSHGGLARLPSLHAAASLLSGPAGGLIGARYIAARLGIRRLVSFDMGGTSTDVALIDGELPRRDEHQIGGIRVQTSMLDVHTIAAGGGSVLRFLDGRASVGPDSAGADPGPACYGRGGPLTLTDVQVLLGRLRPETLPKVFGADAASAIEPDLVERSFAVLARQMAADGATARIEALAESYLEVAVAAMASAIQRVSTRQGIDASELTLFAFGGAAGQHACRVARAAGMRRILMHPLSSVLSAYGIGVADRSALLRASARLPLNEASLAVAVQRLAELERQARAELASETDDPHASIEIARLLELRAGESETLLRIPFAALPQVERAFRETHRRRFGFDPTGLAVTIEALCVAASLAPVHVEALRPVAAANLDLPATARVWFGGWRDVPVLASHRVRGRLEGPALIVEPHSTFVLEPGWTARAMPGGETLAEDEGPPLERSVALAAAARIEIFNNLFMHIAEQMGEVLRQTAQSVNIKERLDYSCALFDPEGGLVANAPHMPVHLGSMGATVRTVIANHRGAMRPGDAWLLNSPYHGGTHLPDMTVVLPVFLGREPPPSVDQSPDFFVASRAHHADVGGATPGSMPAFSSHIDEEGVVFEDFQLVERGRLRARELEARLRSGPYPARNPAQNIADVRAQLAANARGAAELERAVREHGIEAVHDGMRRAQRNAAECVQRAIERLRPGEFRYELDGGQVIAVRIAIDRLAGRARVEFTGTSAQGSHNFNAPRAVCVAAVLYVFRTLVDHSIPLNEGCLEPLELVIPRGSMLDPQPPAAVAAGNVETSQCIVDALYGALGALAASQGTMNNLTFGDQTLQYYETIAGGAGAGPDFDGCDAVQTHMTNSHLTDPEILEARFPVLVREFRLRRGSGGRGRHRGGDGIVRRLLFRAPLSGSLLSNRRRVPPFGLAGGSPGALGAARILRATGEVVELGATARFALQPGDTLEILTPGGGGYGAPD